MLSFFWRACLSLGHGQVDREHSLKVGLSVTFPKVQVANNGVNESKHKGNKKKSEFWAIASVASAEQNRKRLASGDKGLKASGDRKRLYFKVGSIG